MSVRAEALVDLATLRANIEHLAGPACGDPGIERMVVVKADAYGHGQGEVARTVRDMGVPWLGVALPSEALTLRADGDRGRVLAWLYAPGDPGLQDCVASDIDLGVGSLGMLDDVVRAADGAGSVARIHLKVDTGLGRGGCPPALWEQLLDRAMREPRVNVVGIWSHLASADVPDSPDTDAQVAAFERALAQSVAAGVDPEVRHLASSGAALARPDTRYDLVRIGIAAYGIAPGPAIDMGPLRPVMTLRASVATTKRVPAGHGASYNLTWRAHRETTLALVPVGYADGVPRTARKAHVAIAGRRHPVVGRIAMDQVIVDVGDDPVQPGDDVIVWGPGHTGEPTATEWASWDDTIGYEIVTRVGPRVPRRYVEG